MRSVIFLKIHDHNYVSCMVNSDLNAGVLDTQICLASYTVVEVIPALVQIGRKGGKRLIQESQIVIYTVTFIL